MRNWKNLQRNLWDIKGGARPVWFLMAQNTFEIGGNWNPGRSVTARAEGKLQIRNELYGKSKFDIVNNSRTDFSSWIKTDKIVCNVNPKKLLQLTEEPDFLRNVIICDKICIFRYDLETKCKSMHFSTN